MEFSISGSFMTDIITNSSSVVYVVADNKSGLCKIIDEVLIELGSDKRCDDLFNVYIVADDLEDYLLDTNVISDEEFVDLMGFEREGEEIFKRTKDALEAGGNSLKDKVTSGVIMICGDVYDEHTVETKYIVETKDGENSQITRLVANLFYTHAVMG